MLTPGAAMSGCKTKNDERNHPAARDDLDHDHTLSKFALNSCGPLDENEATVGAAVLTLVVLNTTA